MNLANTSPLCSRSRFFVNTVGSQCQLNRNVIEAAAQGWWYAGRLPSGAILAGLHTHPQYAVQLLAEPERWRQALGETRHIGPMLAGTSFEGAPRSHEACGARLDCPGGEGWIACGDAALSFDPISGQGIFSALYSGVTAARAIDEALGGTNARLETYSKTLEVIRRTYISRCLAFYRSEGRWTSREFWSHFSDRGVADAAPTAATAG
jgi:flavin-dependent dehydrogenase